MIYSFLIQFEKRSKQYLLIAFLIILSTGLFSSPAFAHGCYLSCPLKVTDIADYPQSELVAAILGTPKKLTTATIESDETGLSGYSIWNLLGNIIFPDPINPYSAQDGSWDIYWTGNLGKGILDFRWEYPLNSLTGGLCFCTWTFVNSNIPASLQTSSVGTTMLGNISGGVAVSSSSSQDNSSTKGPTVGPGDTIRIEFEAELTDSSFKTSVNSYLICSLTPSGGSVVWYQRDSSGIWGDWDGMVQNLKGREVTWSSPTDIFYTPAWEGNACDLPNGDFSCHVGYSPVESPTNILYNSTPVTVTISGCP